jgi:hypothetical protein
MLSVAFMLLTMRSPIIIACVVGLVLAMVFYRRYRTPARLAIAALVFLLMATGMDIAFPFVVPHDGPFEERAVFIRVFGLVHAGLEAVTTGLFVAAAFVSRKSAEPRLEPMSTGIDVEEGILEWPT